MADLTVVILTRNEENFIVPCINGIKRIAKKIVVVDSFSEDNTVQLAESAGAIVYKHKFENYAKQYMYAVDIADVQTKWILKLDADEHFTEESAKELECLCNENDNTNVTGITVRFVQYFMNRRLKHGGAYPWIKLSVYKTGYGEIENRNMDEHIVLKSGEIVSMKADAIHYGYKDLEYFINKFNWYSTREMMDYYRISEHASEQKALKTWFKEVVYYRLPMGMRSWLYYVYRYYFKLGFLDGKEGKIYAFLHAYWYRFLVDAKIYEHDTMKFEFKETGALK